VMVIVAGWTTDDQMTGEREWMNKCVGD
jgi:hypothetical protein